MAGTGIKLAVSNEQLRKIPHIVIARSFSDEAIFCCMEKIGVPESDCFATARDDV